MSIKNGPVYLCYKCADKYREAYTLTEIKALPGIPTGQRNCSCEDCGKRVYGTYYRITRKES